MRYMKYLNLFVYIFFNCLFQAEVIDVAMIIARCNCNQVTVEMLQDGEGYVSIPEGHTKVKLSCHTP